MQIMNIKIDKELHRRLKSKVAIEGTSMQVKISELITEWLEKDEKTLGGNINGNNK